MTLRLERPLLYAGCLLALAGLVATGHRAAALAVAAVVLPFIAWRLREAMKPKQRVMTWNQPRGIPPLRRRTIYGPGFDGERTADVVRATPD